MARPTSWAATTRSRRVAKRHVRFGMVADLTGFGGDIANILTQVLLPFELGKRSIREVRCQLLSGDPAGRAAQGRRPGGGGHAADYCRMTARPHRHDFRIESGLDPPGVVHPVPDTCVLDTASDPSVLGVPIDVLHRFQGLPDATATGHPLARGKLVTDSEDVTLPDRVPVDAHALTQEIHHPFDGKGGLVRAEPPHGAARRVVGVDRLRLDVHIGHVIRTAGVASRSLQDFHSHRSVRASVTDDAGAHRLQFPLGICAERVVQHDGMSFGMDPDGLLPREHGLDRARKPHGGNGRLRLDGEVFLAAERTAVRDELDVDARRFNPENLRDLLLIVVHALPL